MIDFQQKRKFRNIAFHKVTLGVFFVAVLIAANSTFGVFQKKRASEKAKNISLQNTQELRTRQTDLEKKIERLETTTGTEEEIRSKFNVVKEGESMVVVVEEQDQEVSTTSPNRGFWQKLLDFLSW